MLKLEYPLTKVVTLTSLTDILVQHINTLRKNRGLSINKLATISALPPSSVKNILYGKSNDPKIRTLKKLCDGLEITLGEFFSTPEFEKLEQEIR